MSRPFKSEMNELDEAEVLRLVTLPEHEYRLALTRAVFTIKRQIDENRELTANVEETVNRDLKEIKEMLTAINEGLTFFRVGRKIVVWLTAIAVGFTALVAALKAAENTPEIWRALLSLVTGPKK